MGAQNNGRRHVNSGCAHRRLAEFDLRLFLHSKGKRNMAAENVVESDL